MKEWNEQDHYSTVDLPFYREEVEPLLPNTVLDFHAHVWDKSLWKINPWDEKRDGADYMVTDTSYTFEELDTDAERIFPGKEYRAVCFGNPTPAADIERTNEWVADGARAVEDRYPLMLAGKGLMDRERLEETLTKGGFYGYKVFLNWFGDNYGDVLIEDMLGSVEMETAEAHRLVVLLHVPRSGRLADPEIGRGVRDLAAQYPNAQIVLAHCGRCYLPDRMAAAVGSIIDHPNVYLDTSMVMDPTVFEIILENIPSERLLFATDFPVPAMRGRRVYVMDHWVDLVLPGYPESGYRVQSTNMRATFMVYEIVLALRRAAERIGLSAQELEAIFYKNGIKVLERVKR